MNLHRIHSKRAFITIPIASRAMRFDRKFRKLDKEFNNAQGAIGSEQMACRCSTTYEERGRVGGAGAARGEVAAVQ